MTSLSEQIFGETEWGRYIQKASRFATENYGEKGKMLFNYVTVGGVVYDLMEIQKERVTERQLKVQALQTLITKRIEDYCSEKRGEEEKRAYLQQQLELFKQAVKCL